MTKKGIPKTQDWFNIWKCTLTTAFIYFNSNQEWTGRRPFIKPENSSKILRIKQARLSLEKLKIKIPEWKTQCYKDVHFFSESIYEFNITNQCQNLNRVFKKT